MNPYTYSRKQHKAGPQKRQSGAADSALSFARSFFNTEINALVAIALVTFLATSAAAATLAAQSEMAGPLDNFSFSLSTAHASVLGESTSGARVGQLVYNPGNRTIYLVGNSGLYGFPSATVFYSWGYKFEQVVPANAAEQALTMVGLVPGKQAGCGNPLEQITGSCNGSSLLSVPDSSSSSVRVGKLVYNPGNLTIYLVGQNGLYGFTNAATFFSWGYKFEQIVEANSAELALPILTVYVPVKSGGCASPLDQIANKCQNDELKPAIKVISPNGGESWKMGSAQTITWTGGSYATAVPIYLLQKRTLNGQDSFYNIYTIGSVNGQYGVYTWTVPSELGPVAEGNNYYIQVGCWSYGFAATASCNGDISDAPFSIAGAASTSNTPPEFVMPIVGDYSNVIVNSSFGFNLSATDAQGGQLIAKVNWGDTLVDVQTISSHAGTAAAFERFSHNYTQPGNYTITITVSDSQSLSTVKTAAITVINSASSFAVSPSYLSFTAQAGNNIATALQAISVTPAGATSGWTAQVQTGLSIPGLNLSYANAVGAIVSGSGAATFSASIVGPFTAGTYNSVINITSGGQTKTVPVYLTVSAAASLNRAPSVPVMSLGPSNGMATVNVGQQFNFMSTDPDNDPLSFSINWGDGTTATVLPGQQTSSGSYIVGALHTWTAAGSYTINVTASDGKGAYSYGSVPITAAGLTAQTASLTANGHQSITVNKGSVINYQWSSANADSVDSYYSVDRPDTCGNNSTATLYSWIINNSNRTGSQSATVQDCQAGVTYTITYRAYKSGAPQAFVLSTVVVRVNP